MSVPITQHPVPYYAQWESRSLVPEFITGRRDAADDPLWQKSGADTAQEYAFWAPRICGVACLRMMLDFWKYPVPSSVPLARELCEAGAYVRSGDAVQGLIYRPFADLVEARWGLKAEVAVDLPVFRIREALAHGRLVMVSVHKTIRTPETNPPDRGGHLVLGVGADDRSVLVHNPSGLPGRSQEFARIPWERFERFCAGRGVIVGA